VMNRNPVTRRTTPNGHGGHVRHGQTALATPLLRAGGNSVGKTSARREAKLRTACAARHPTLPVHMWTSAATLANLVASLPSLQAAEITTSRPLLDTDFEFRGGRRRWLAGWIARTRIGELTSN